MLSLRVALILMWFMWWQKDTHPYPHPTNHGGGCYCTCKLCIRLDDDDTWRCICRRCNQDCTTLGRIGRDDAVGEERAAGYPISTRVWSRYYLTKTGERIWGKVNRPIPAWFIPTWIIVGVFVRELLERIF